MASNLPTEERELNLVLKLELRMGSADSDEKLQALLQTFLAPLVLKLASEHISVRNKVIGVCQYISRRLKSSPSISLPLPALLKQFRETNNSFVKHFDVLYIQQGLERLSTDDGLAILPDLLRIAVPSTVKIRNDSSEGKTWSIAFHFLLRLLSTWKLPHRLSKEDEELKGQLDMSDTQSDILTTWLFKFLLYDGKGVARLENGAGNIDLPLSAPRGTSLSQDEVDFFLPFDEASGIRPSPARLQSTKAQVANFLFTSLFTDAQRFIPAVILSSDTTNLEVFRIGDTMFKQCNFDLESKKHIDDLFSLYDGVKPKVQIRALGLLSKSKQATKQTTITLRMIDRQFGLPAEGLEATKLRTALFTFLDWTVRVGDDADLQSIGPTVQKVMRDFIEIQGWPNPNYALGEGERLSSAQLDMRKKAYECIGSLAAKSRPEFEIVKFLFTSLRSDSSDRDVHASINDALGRVTNYFAVSGDGSRDMLKALLLQNMTLEVGEEDPAEGYTTVWSTRYASIKCINKCLPFEDVDARYIDLLAMGGKPVGERKEILQEIAEEGVRGLDLYLHHSSLPSASQGHESAEKRIPVFEDLIERVFGRNGIQISDPKNYSQSMINPAVSFARNMLLIEALKAVGKRVGDEPEWQRNMDGLVANDEEARKSIRTHLLSTKQEPLLRLLEATLTGMSLGLQESALVAMELCSLAPNDVLVKLGDSGVNCCRLAVRSTNLKVQDCAARVFGILASLPTYSQSSSSTESLIGSLANWRNAIGQKVIEVRGSLLSLAFEFTRLSLRQRPELVDNHIGSFSHLIMEIISKSRDETLKEAANVILGQLCLCLPNTSDPSWDEDELVVCLLQEAKKERESAVSALGRLIRFMSGDGNGIFVSLTLDKLYALHETRKPELHFAVGETLAVAAAGWNSTSTIVDFDVDTSRPSRPVDGELLSKILTKVFEDCKTTKPSLKKAAAIWLLCLIQYCGKETAIKSQLRSCQVAFARLLTDRDEIVQETGSRGLSLVYEMGDAEIRTDLVRDLVQSFTGSSAKMSGSVNEDTELFEAGALPTEGGASVTTYKDIVSLASEMGDPSLIYRFMNLASNNAIWTSRAAFGKFGLSNILADSAYLAENKKFYPKLFRYRFDPNPNVQRSMNDIWKALVKNPGAVLDENFDLIITDLLKSILGKEWRVREACCAALGDLVQDRDVEKYGKYLEEVWNVAFKVMDDIKETVRIAALKLCRTLTNLLIRNLEVGDGLTKRANIMLEHALSFLIKQFTSGGAKEVQTYAISSLLEVIRKCPPKALRPYASLILENLIIALSSLEHESINYLHLNADKYGFTTDKLDKMRVSGINASPVTECIDRCLESLDSKSGETEPELAGIVKDTMRRLESTFKDVIGLPSKVGLSRVIVTLVVRHNLMFRPYADRFAQLVRKHIRDRNITISISYATSLAYLMRLASEKQVLETCRFAMDLYFTSEESSGRALAGEIVQAISKVSNDVFLRFATSFLPFAFVGRNDTDVEVRDRFDATWKENVGGSRSINLYLPEIVEIVKANIKSPRWAVKHACCLATADLVSSMEVQEQYTNSQIDLIWPVLEESLSGKTWEGKETVILAYPKFVKKARCLLGEAQKGRQMRLIALREAKRTNAPYRPHAITALGEFAAIREDLELSSEVGPLLKMLVEELTADDADHMEIDAGIDAGQHASKDIVEKTMTAAVKCLFQILSPLSGADVLEQALWIVGQAQQTGLKSSRMALIDGAKSWIEKISQAISAGAGGEFENNNKEKLELFTGNLVLALLAGEDGPSSGATRTMTAYEADSENLRKARVNLGLALTTSHVASVVPRGTLVRIFKVWLETERSGSLRIEIQKLLLANHEAPQG